MFHSLTARVTVSVLFIPLCSMSVVFLPSLEVEVRKKGGVGESLLVVARRSGSRAHLMKMVMTKFVFALLVPLLAARSLLFL